MAMRETAHSLGLYFGLIGFFGLLKSLYDLLGPGLTFAGRGVALVDVVLACCYIYIGLSVNKLLASSPKFIVGVILIRGFFAGVGIVVGIVTKQYGSVSTSVGLLLIYWYLLVNTRRLAQEQHTVVQTR